VESLQEVTPWRQARHFPKTWKPAIKFGKSGRTALEEDQEFGRPVLTPEVLLEARLIQF